MMNMSAQTYKLINLSTLIPTNDSFDVHVNELGLTGCYVLDTINKYVEKTIVELPSHNIMT